MKKGNLNSLAQNCQVNFIHCIFQMPISFSKSKLKSFQNQMSDEADYSM